MKVRFRAKLLTGQQGVGTGLIAPSSPLKEYLPWFKDQSGAVGIGDGGWIRRKPIPQMQGP